MDGWMDDGWMDIGTLASMRTVGDAMCLGDACLPR